LGGDTGTTLLEYAKHLGSLIEVTGMNFPAEIVMFPYLYPVTKDLKLSPYASPGLVVGDSRAQSQVQTQGVAQRLDHVSGPLTLKRISFDKNGRLLAERLTTPDEISQAIPKGLPFAFTGTVMIESGVLAPSTILLFDTFRKRSP